MGDLVDVVAGDLLEINEEREREEQVRMVKFTDEKKEVKKRRKF